MLHPHQNPTASSPGRSQTLDILLSRHNGALRLPLALAVAALSMPLQTARNQLVEGRFPLPTHTEGRLRFVLTVDLAAHLDALAAPATHKKLMPGRASKTEQAAARAAGFLTAGGKADITAYRAAQRAQQQGGVA